MPAPSPAPDVGAGNEPIHVVAGLARRACALADDIQDQIHQMPPDASTDELAILANALVRLAGRMHGRAEALAGPTAGELDDAPEPHDGSAPVVRRSGLSIIAVNLALEGRSRGEIERYLLHRFGVEDAGELIDDALKEG